MTKKQKIFDKAYKRLTELYGEKYHAPDIRIISRFYEEKKILRESELYLCYLDFIGRLKETAEQKGEHVTVSGTTGSSLIAYLLGATDINPLPRHEYCPCCHTTRFIAEGSPFDSAPVRCSCGTDIIVDGYNIPFESNIKSILSEYIQIGVSYEFFEEAKHMICAEKWDKAIVTLRNETISPVKFIFLDREKYEEGEYSFEGNNERFSAYPHITLTPNKMLGKYRELEKATGIRMKDISFEESRFVFSSFTQENIRGIPQLDNGFMKGMFEAVHPQSCDELLKLIGLAHSTDVWRNNAEELFDNHRVSLREIPAYAEELFNMIYDSLRKKGIYETGFAYEVTEKARQGYYALSDGIDEDTMLTLLSLGFDMDFVFFIEKINYLFPKAHGVLYLKDTMRLMFYKSNFKDEFEAVMKREL